MVATRVDSRNLLTLGPRIAYIYPDLETALIGQFENGMMISGQETRITDVTMDGSVLIPTFVKTTKTAPRVKFSKSTKAFIGDQPLISDPYESKHVSCSRSSLDTDVAGEGLFAKVDMPAGTIPAFYNGVRLPFVLGGPKEDWYVG